MPRILPVYATDHNFHGNFVCRKFKNARFEELPRATGRSVGIALRNVSGKPVARIKLEFRSSLTPSHHAPVVHVVSFAGCTAVREFAHRPTGSNPISFVRAISE